MSHEVLTRNGHTHAVYGDGKAAWHREGTVVDGLMTAAQVVEFAKFPEIITTPSFMRVEINGIPQFVEAKGYALTAARWHDGAVTPLGQVTNRWKPIQAAAAFSICDPIVKEAGAIYEAAGVLMGGKRFWVLARIPGHFDMKVEGDRVDRSERFLLFETANDGSGSATVRPTWIRVVCWNTLSAALSGGGAVNIRHTGDVDAKIEVARATVEDAFETFKRGEEQFRLMAETPLTQDQRARYVSEVLGIDIHADLSTRSKNILGDVAAILSNGRGTSQFASQKETLWGAFNGLTEYVDHARVVRNADNGRLASIGFGSGDRVKRKALEIAVRIMADGTEQEVEVVTDAPTEAHGEDLASILRRPASLN